MSTLQQTDPASAAPGAPQAAGNGAAPQAPGTPQGGSLLRWHVIRAIFRRNIGAYFINPAGYVFIALFVLVSAVAFFRAEFFANNLASLDTLNAMMPYLLLFFIPAVTMSVWAEERKQGTDELLLTLPARDVEVVLGKYFAALGIYTVALAFTFSLVIMLAFLGRPDWGVVFATYLGYWLMGAMLLAIGMTASLLTNNVTVAFILGAIFCAIPVFFGQLDRFSGTSWGRQVVEDVSVAGQFRSFGTGLVAFAGIFYYVALAAVFLYLNVILLGRRHWAGGERDAGLTAQALTRWAALGVALASVTVLIGSLGWQVDASAEQTHSLSPGTREIIAKLPKDRPVLVQAFYSTDVPRDYVGVRNNLVNLLRQFKAWGGSKIELNLVETEPYSEAALKANRMGIQARTVFSETEARRSTSDIYMGVVFTSGAEQVTVPFIDPGLSVEYELARSIRTVAGEVRKKVGVLSTDANLMTGGGMMGDEHPEPAFITELKQQYEVKSIVPDTPISRADCDMLIVALPHTLTQPQMDNLDKYIQDGGPTLMFVDPLPLTNMMLSPELPKPTPRNPGMFGGSPPPQEKGNLTALLERIGVDWPQTQIVWNDVNPHPQITELLQPEFVFISPGQNKSAFNEKETPTSGLQEVVAMFGGRLVKRSKSGLEFVPLLKTGDQGGSIDWRDTVRSRLPFGDDVVQSIQMASQMGIPGAVTINPDRARKRRESKVEYVMAAHVRPDKDAKAAEAQPKANVIVVADFDMISDEFFGLRRESAEMLARRGLGNMVLDNVTFALNCVDQLAGDETFVALRKRRPSFRTLETLEEQTKVYAQKAQAELQKAQQDADGELDQARRDLNKDAEAVEKDTSLSETARLAKLNYLQGVANRRLEEKREVIESGLQEKIGEIKGEKERQVRAIQNNAWSTALIIPPLLPAALGLGVFFYRRGRENRGANPNRLA